MKIHAHKLSIKMVCKYVLMAIESLVIKNKVKNYLARAIMDASWGIFLRMLEDKAEWFGKHMCQSGAFFCLFQVVLQFQL